MSRKHLSDSDHVKNRSSVFGIVSRVSMAYRLRMLETLTELANPSEETAVLDVGVTSDRASVESNFFEKHYRFSHRITSVGVEDASFLEAEFPGLKFVRASGLRLPFPDKSFDLAVSFAVLEHVGPRKHQQQFLRELCRVSKHTYVTMPNRWYPLEIHTALPLVHWLPRGWAGPAMRVLGKEYYSREENLNLMSKGDALAMFPDPSRVKVIPFRLLGPVSNFAFYRVD